MSFELPFDIFLAIFSHLSVYDVLRVRQACRTFQELSQLRSLWHGLFNKHVLEQNVPVPGLGSQSVGDLTAAELESYTFHALRLRRTWSSVNPSHGRQLELPSNIPGCRVISLHFLSTTGSSNYLLSVLLTHHDGQRLFTVQCWDIQASPPKCIAVRTFTQFKGLVINQNPTKFGVLAINSSNVEIFDIDCTISDPTNAFVVTSQFPEVVERIHLFSGSRLLTRDGIGRTHLWDVEYPEVKVEIKNPHNVQFEVILAAYIDDTRLIVIRTTELEVYTLPGSVTQVLASSMPPSGLILDPILYHKWPWRIDSVVLSPQHSWSRAGTKNRATLNILLRFGSLFPWVSQNQYKTILG
ncbi:hypothetical protein BDQ12DRAFT_681146 [Crucibulum laeve]|uniref:F-box domain-containing protein n=1 Tax=Crucibulum laeve TaxID=68775 RepID=A0A5C3M540_9AGAR|nr:hypothetical protein BDQ12DRAFT_681146 [Crucibulum laeve]